MEKGLISRILRCLAATAFGQVITIVIQLVSVPLVLHFWGDRVYGEWLVLSVIPAYFAMSDVGFASIAANQMTILMAKGERQTALEVHGDFVYEHNIIAQYRSGYRPNIEKDRLLQYLSDEARIYTRIIPDSMKAFSEIDPERVPRASRSKCRSAIAYASQMVLPEERANVCSVIEEWAKTAKCESEMRKFTSGEKLRFKSGPGILRKTLRSVYQVLHR